MTDFDTKPISYVDVSANLSTGKVPDCGANCHRKVHGYLKYMDQHDSAYGHGTQIAGTAAGSAADASNLALASFNSNVPASKVLMIDIGCSGAASCTCIDCDCPRVNTTSLHSEGRCAPDKTRQTVHPPDDFDFRLFPWASNNGADIFVAAWGDEGNNGAYTTHAYEIDKYTWEHRNFLPIFSAGNDGALGPYTVASTASAKNVLTVGETMTNQDIWESNAPFWSLHEEAWQVRDELMLANCGTACTSCQTFQCQQAMQFGPQTNTSNTQSCCLYADEATKRKCCTSQYQPYETARNGDPKISDYYLIKKRSAQNLRTRSARGPTLDGRVKPDVVAIGDQIVTAKAGTSRPQDFAQCNSASQVSQLTQDSGTSLATGVVASVAGLLKEFFVEGWYPTGEIAVRSKFQPSGVLLKAMIIAMGVRLKGMVDLNGKGNWGKLADGTNSRGTSGMPDGRAERWAFSVQDPGYAIQSFAWSGTEGPNYYYGFGRVQADKTINFRPNLVDKMNVIAAGDSTIVSVGCTIASCQGAFYDVVTATGEAWAPVPGAVDNEQCPSTHRAASVILEGKKVKEEMGGAGPGLSYCMKLTMRAPSNTQYKYDLKQGEAHGRCIAVNGVDRDIAVTLVWNDYPASPGSGKTLVNDLDLEVIFRGRKILGNSIYERDRTKSIRIQRRDDINNVEQVVIPKETFQVGDVYMILVKASKIGAGGAQPYALVTTGTAITITKEGQGNPDKCPECVAAATRMCDLNREKFSAGALARQTCSAEGSWGSCNVYQCREGYEIVYRGISVDCGKWLDQKMAFEKVVQQVSTASTTNGTAGGRRLLHNDVETDDHAGISTRSHRQRRQVIAELLSMPTEGEEASLDATKAVATSQRKIDQVNKKISKAKVVQQQWRAQKAPTLGHMELRESDNMLPALPNAAHFMLSKSHKAMVSRYPDTLYQYFVRVRHAGDPIVHATLKAMGVKNTSTIVFSPQMMYVTTTAETALHLSAMPWVLRVAAYETEHKIANGKIESVSTHKDHKLELLFVRLAHGDHVDAKRTANDLRTMLSLFASNTTVGVHHTHELSIATLAQYLSSIADTVAQHPHVRWIEQYTPKTPKSNYARWVAQTNEATVGTQGKMPYWDAELDGRFIGDYKLNGAPPTGPYKYAGEEFMMQDTGIDLQNCFFYDSVTRDPKQVNDAGPANANFWEGHRNVAAHWPFMDGIDYINGHGTHGAGLVVGAPETTLIGPMQDFKGLVPKGKMFFMDVGCNSAQGCKCHHCDCVVYGNNNGTESACPRNDKRLQFPLCNFKTTGCEAYGSHYGILHWSEINQIQVILQAYADDATGYAYGRDAVDIDTYLYNQMLNSMDTVMIIAAGDNADIDGFSGIKGAALSKNAIIVGASQTSPAAYIQAVGEFSEEGSSGKDDSVRLDLLKKTREAYQTQTCRCDDTSCDSPDPAKSQCGMARSLTTRDACCQSKYANFCCKWTRLTSAEPQTKVPGFSNLQRYGLQNLHSSSSRGPLGSRRYLPHVVGLGMVAGPRALNQACRPTGTTNLAVMAREGTSVAAAHVAGLVGIIRQYFRNGFYPNRYKSIGEKYHGYKWTRAGEEDFTPTAALIRNLLNLCALPLTGAVENHAMTEQRGWSRIASSQLRWGQPAPTYVSGMGRPQLNKCLPLLGDPWRLLLEIRKIEVNEALRLEFRERGLTLSQKRSFCFVVQSAVVDIRVGLVWTDPPGLESNGNTPDAEKPLVHDLDLTVYGGGVNRLGNEQFKTIGKMDEATGTPNEQGFGETLATHDRDNNWEIVVIPKEALKAGDRYRVQVKGYFVRNSEPKVAQDYSLVVLGDVSDMYDTKDKPRCPECEIPKSKACLIPAGCEGDACIGRGRMQCTERGVFSECLYVSCKSGYMPTGFAGKNACVKYQKTQANFNVEASLRLTGDISTFSAIPFEVQISDQLSVANLTLNNDRVKVTNSFAGSIIVNFKIAAFLNTTTNKYDMNELRQVEAMMLEWQPGTTVAGYTLLEVRSLSIVDSTPAPPYCGDLGGLFLLYGWCDFEYVFIWNDKWGGVMVLLASFCAFICLVQYGLEAIRELLDKSMTPAEANIAIKLALSSNAAEVVRLTTTDRALMHTMHFDKIYDQISKIFRLWAFHDAEMGYDHWKDMKVSRRAFLMWADPTCVPGNQSGKTWDMMFIGQGKGDLVVDIELSDLARGGFKGVQDTITGPQYENTKWTPEEDEEFRQAMTIQSNGAANDLGFVPDFLLFEDVWKKCGYCGRDGRSVPDLQKRWMIIAEQNRASQIKTDYSAQYLHGKQGQRHGIQDYSADVMELFTNSKGQRLLKKVGAKLFKQDALRMVQQWKANVDADGSTAWFNMGLAMPTMGLGGEAANYV